MPTAGCDSRVGSRFRPPCGVRSTPRGPADGRERSGAPDVPGSAETSGWLRTRPMHNNWSRPVERFAHPPCAVKGRPPPGCNCRSRAGPDRHPPGRSQSRSLLTNRQFHCGWLHINDNRGSGPRRSPRGPRRVSARPSAYASGRPRVAAGSRLAAPAGSMSVPFGTPMPPIRPEAPIPTSRPAGPPVGRPPAGRPSARSGRAAPQREARTSAETCCPTPAATATFPEAVRENEEVVPVNAVSTWVLSSGVTVGR